MTLQIGMVGSDGIVVVGDTWQFVDPSDRPWYGYDAPKIRVSASQRIAVAGAHNMDVFAAIADRIFSELAEPTDARIDRITAIGKEIAEGQDSECLVAFSDPWPILYRFGHAQSGETRCEHIYGAFAIGNHSNPAAWYWSKRFYDCFLPCQKLKRLGALIVTSSGKINNGSIGGLDGFTCDTEGIHTWTRDESNALYSEMTGLENSFGRSILGT